MFIESDYVVNQIKQKCRYFSKVELQRLDMNMVVVLAFWQQYLFAHGSWWAPLTAYVKVYVNIAVNPICYLAPVRPVTGGHWIAHEVTVNINCENQRI